MKVTNLLSIILATLALSLLAACTQVDTGERGIKTRFGEIVGDPLPEGLYFYNALTTSITEFKVRETTWENSTPIFTRDTQRVEVAFAITFYPDPLFVTKIYKEIGREDDLIAKIIMPVVLGSIKDSVGSVIADELVGKREAVTKAALAEVKENLSARHVIVTDLQFTNLDFDDAYEKAVEEKVVAIQRAKKAINDTERIKEEATQTIKTAIAEADAMKIKTTALSQSKSLVEYEAVQKWNGVLPQYMFGGGSTPFIDIRGIGTKGKE